MYYIYYFENEKENDLNNIIKFIEESSEIIYDLVLTEKLNKGFYRYSDNNNPIKLEEWVKDVKDLVAIELRNLKISILTKDDLADIWAKFDKSGLTGIQLVSKINFWAGLIEVLRKSMKNIGEIIQRAFYRDLKNALKATNILLGSIITIISAFEPLKELKDFFELSLELREDLE